MTCPHEDCGKGRGRGHPRTGWIQVHVAASDERCWYCSWRCVIRRGLTEHVPDDVVGEISVELERTSDGLKMRSRLLPGWGRFARGPFGIARALEDLWREVDIARYSFDRGELPELVMEDGHESVADFE